jgi:trk system potassium uptake protein TrkA
VGCGKVGVTLVEQLSLEGHDITVVDKRSELVQSITDQYDVMGLVGNGASYSVQMEAGIESADLLIAVTHSDELNLLCCTVAKRVGNCAAIARVRNPDYSQEVSYLREKLGLAMIINPELEAGKEIARILSLPNALGVSTFSRGRTEMVRFKISKGSPLGGKLIADLGKEEKNSVLICALEREGQVEIPWGGTRLQEGDIISVLASPKSLRKFFKRIGVRTNQCKDVMIIGGGKSSYYLAKQLLNLGIEVKIIEQDRSRCEELNELLPEAIIINGDGTDEELLKEVGIQTVDAFVALTGIDEENILLTLHAREVTGAKIVTKINRMNFHEVINHLDLGSVIYPRYIIAEAIIAYVRAKTASLDSNVETLYHLLDGRAEAIEFRVGKVPEVTDIPLSRLPLKDHLLISCINRGGRVIIPGGQDVIRTGDSVVVVTTHTGFHDIQDILA